MTSTIRRVLIIGGGFTGTSAAILLKKQGLTVDLVELDPNWRTDGAGITVSGPSLRAIEQIGILEEFRLQGALTNNVDMYTADGQYLRQIPTPPVPGSSISGGGGIMRPVLAGILNKATVAAGVNTRLGLTYESIEQNEQGVSVTFTDGTHSEYDAVLACDGVNSQTRQQFFPNAANPSYTGQVVWRAVLERDGLPRPAMFFGPNGKLGFTPVSDTKMYLHYTEETPTKKRVPKEQRIDYLKELIAPFSAPAVEKVKKDLNEDSHVLARFLEGMIVERPWSNNRILLMGDAVHATTPHLASGAGMGHEDAVVIAEEIANGGTVQEIFKRFEDRRWARCSLIVNQSRRLGEIERLGGSKIEHIQIMALSMSALMAPI